MDKSNVSIKDTDLFKDMLEVIKEIIHDERIDNEVRQYYINSFNNIVCRR